ncbi:septation ring formation regulator EzrA [Evansella cellulosilytica]|uniref:Septation ring formation regulator EzrA n=1 Tax=Evansella cellulosilytica (strain ATCC 21833 / DSM 2522 / FERM P-1141 / JCM 9156 / N-4) TaxID=649639 RepID=E6U154_EVAC2|nr:septation ring formation regulator EzrA [Evansella cellulosilytica]ADU31500.1 Septation ring formation regulator EzrA [Evansella cellulosilytica DSM 2522]
MYIVYGLVVLVLIIIGYGAWSRRRIYKEVDQLENKKIQLMNEPVTEELSKLKGLKMLGETEERFEQWREGWDEIVTLQLPDIEEKLFDIEESANKYRFGKARRISKFVNKELDKIKEHLSEMLDEVEHLVHSEEQNRQDIHEVKDYYQETKKKLWSQKGTLGGTGLTLERAMKELQLLFQGFEESTEQGNYLQARDLLIEIRSELDYFNDVMTKAPQYLVLIEKELPRQLEELETGIEEMEENGYNLEHFSFHLQINDMKRRLVALLPLLEGLKIGEIVEPLDEIQKEIDTIYDKLEYEALSKQLVDKELPFIEERVMRLPNIVEQLLEETERVKLSYKLSEDEDRNRLKIEKEKKDISHQLIVIVDSVKENNQSFTAIRSMMKEFSEKLQQLENEIEAAKERLSVLRSEERTAENRIYQLKEKLLYGKKKLKKSNIPGVPDGLLYELDEAEKALFFASDKLNEIPLAIEEVMMKVEDAEMHVDRCIDKLLLTIKEASQAESAIQYGNRYRRHSDEINIKLLQAEDLFRHYQYNEAFEWAVSAIEPIDPDVKEKLSSHHMLETSR